MEDHDIKVEEGRDRKSLKRRRSTTLEVIDLTSDSGS